MDPSAEQSKNIGALSKIFAPTMVYMDYDGALRTRDQLLNYVKNDASSPDQLVSEDLNIHSYGNFAVVTGIFRGKWNKGGKVPRYAADMWTLGPNSRTLGNASPRKPR